MLKIRGNTLYLTRGDTANIKVKVRRNGKCYTPEEGDTIRFALTASPVLTDSTAILVKSIPIDTMILTLDPVDTADLEFERYKYDIKLSLANNGGEHTIIEDASLNITPNVPDTVEVSP